MPHILILHNVMYTNINVDNVFLGICVGHIMPFLHVIVETVQVCVGDTLLFYTPMTSHTNRSR